MANWIPVADVIAVVNKSIAGDWHWWANTRCKYIDVRIDMRDGCCVLKDRDGNVIDLAKLQYQSGEPT